MIISCRGLGFPLSISTFGLLRTELELHVDLTDKVRMKPDSFLCFLPGALNHTHEKSKWSFTFSVWDLRSITVKEEGWSRLVFGMKEPPTLLPSLHFHLGGSEGFIDCLRRYIIITE